MVFSKIVQNIYQFSDAVNVYIIKNGNTAILIDFGSGDVLNHLSEIGVERIEYVFHTHYHRDQCYGDATAIENNIKIAGPEKEKKLFLEAEKFWKTRSYYHIYNLQPSFFVSAFNIPLSLTFREGDMFEFGPNVFKIIETSGHTPGSITYLVNNNNKIFAFTGDLIHAGAKVITYYDLQYFYGDNGEGGIISSLESFKKLLNNNPFMLFPAHGKSIQNPKKIISDLQKKLERAREVFSTTESSIMASYSKDSLDKRIKSVDLKNLFPHIIHEEDHPPYIIVGNNQNCIVIDYSGSDFFGFKETELFKILKENNIKKIDFIIPTHYHDDHTAGIPSLQKKYDVKVHALKNMVDILENPTHYRMGCLMDTPILVDRVLKDGDIFKWDEYDFQVFHFPGQTEFHMGLFSKIDGKTVFFTGDSLNPNILHDRRNSVNCINLCRLGKDRGYMKCADVLLKCNPEYVAISHHGIIKVENDLLNKYKEMCSNYEPLISDLVAQDDPNMGFDPNWICFKPIRIITEPGREFKTNLAVRNYLDKKSSINIKLNLPADWKANFEEKTHYLEKRSYKEIPMSITIPKNEKNNERTMITANIIWNGMNLGPFPDLMIDHGYIPSDSWTGWTPDKKLDLLSWIFKHIRIGTKFFN